MQMINYVQLLPISFFEMIPEVCQSGYWRKISWHVSAVVGTWWTKRKEITVWTRWEVLQQRTGFFGGVIRFNEEVRSQWGNIHNVYSTALLFRIFCETPEMSKLYFKTHLQNGDDFTEVLHWSELANVLKWKFYIGKWSTLHTLEEKQPWRLDVHVQRVMTALLVPIFLSWDGAYSGTQASGDPIQSSCGSRTKDQTGFGEYVRTTATSVRKIINLTYFPDQLWEGHEGGTVWCRLG